MKNNTLRNKNTNKRVLWIALLAALLFGNGQILLAQHSYEHEHESHGGTRTDAPARLEMDLALGSIQFTNTTVTYYGYDTDSAVIQKTYNRVAGDSFKIYQTNSSTPTNHTISVGTIVRYNSNAYGAGCETAGTLVSVKTVIYLAGINMHKASSLCPSTWRQVCMCSDLPTTVK